MKRRTYKNFMIVFNILQNVKHYNPQEAEELARKVFDNVEADRGRGDRNAEYFLEKIIPAEEFYAQ